MSSPLISLMMPMYNTVQFLNAAVNSVLAQTYPNWELVIVDDASDDGSYELATALALKDPRIKLHKNESKLGIARNRHRAAGLCTGEFIGHIDSDDMLERWALEEMLRVFNSKPDVALAYSDFAQVDVKGKVELYSASHDYDPSILHRHGWRHFGVYRKSAYDATQGFNTKLLNGCEDGDLFMQIAEQFSCYRTPKVLYYYRSHSTNTTRTMKKCDDCTQRMDCNYMRVWAKAANYDPITFTPLKKD